MIQLGPSEQAAKTSQANLTVMITTNRSLSRSYSGTLTHSLTAKMFPFTVSLDLLHLRQSGRPSEISCHCFLDGGCWGQDGAQSFMKGRGKWPQKGGWKHRASLPAL